MDVLLVFDFLLIRQFGDGCLMLLLQLSHRSLVFLLCSNLFLFAAGDNVLVIFRVVMRFEVSLCVSDQFGNLIFVLSLYSLGGFQLGLHTAFAFCLFLSSVDAVALEVIQIVHELYDLVRTVSAKFIDLRLNFADIIVNWLAKFGFPLRSKNCTICHLFYPPLTGISHSVSEVLPGSFPSC